MTNQNPQPSASQVQMSYKKTNPNRKKNTLGRIKAVQDKFNELTAVRVDGIKLSITSIVSKISKDFFLSENRVYEYLRTNVEEKQHELDESIKLKAQATLF